MRTTAPSSVHAASMARRRRSMAFVTASSDSSAVIASRTGRVWSNSWHEANPLVGIILDPLLILLISPHAAAHFLGPWKPRPTAAPDVRRHSANGVDRRAATGRSPSRQPRAGGDARCLSRDRIADI